MSKNNWRVDHDGTHYIVHRGQAKTFFNTTQDLESLFLFLAKYLGYTVNKKAKHDDK